MKKKIIVLSALFLLLMGCSNNKTPDNSVNNSSENTIVDSNSQENSESPISGIDENVAKYYEGIQFSKTGKELKTQLSTLLVKHKNIGYSALLNAFKTTDVREDGKVYDMYSLADFEFDVDKDPGTGGTKEGEYYNREHSIPNSWFGGKKAESSPMYSDLFHLYPTDKYVNNERGNYPYGETNGPKKFNNGSKLGSCTFSGYTGTVFEPIDEYKGDFARSYFYFVTCYEKENITQTSEAKVVFEKDGTISTLTTYAKNLFLKWSKNDPVSEKEIKRNNEVYKYQNNRNPFIDIPGLEESIFA